MRIAIDIMGGDFAPAETVKGALLAADRLHPVGMILVGDEARIRTEVTLLGGLPNNASIHHAPSVISMDESPVEALKKKPDSSIQVCMNLMKSGMVDAVVSAGNTGSTVACATLTLGLLEGVKRPGIAASLPREEGFTSIIDVGANINCKPIHLLQYGLLASTYVSEVFEIENPRVGLLNIGEERLKGPELIRETLLLFEKAPFNFAGYAEGQDIFKPRFDVVVCDGFVGNVILKLSEGLAEMLFKKFRKELDIKERKPRDTQKLLRWRSIMARFRRRIGRAFRKLRRKTDYAEYGGAPLLGVNGTLVICHGRSNARAIANSIRIAVKLASNNLNERITEKLKLIPELEVVHDKN